ncbi:MAG: hypothetical protein AAFR03_07200 [Pseudomonadota bacterium]
MRFILIALVFVGTILWLCYNSVVTEHDVLTQIETSVAAPEAAGRDAEGAAPRSGTGSGTEDSSQGEDADEGGFFDFGKPKLEVPAFDIAGDADEIGFNCPFGIEALDPERVAIIDPGADRLLLYSVTEDTITGIEPLHRSEGFDTVAAVAHEGDLFIGERSLSGRDTALRQLTFGNEAGVVNASVSNTDELPAAVIQQLEGRGFTLSSSTLSSPTLSSAASDQQRSDNGEEASISRTQIETGSVSATTSNGETTSIDYEIENERFLKLVRRLPSGETTDVVVHARRPISVVRLAQIDDNGDIYLSMTEELRKLKVYRSDETIIKLPADAQEDVTLYYVPRSRVCTPRQNTTILPNGDVVSIFVRLNDVSLVKLRPKGQWQWRVRTARDTSGEVLAEQFREELKPVDETSAKYPDFKATLPPLPGVSADEEGAAAPDETDDSDPTSDDTETSTESLGAATDEPVEPEAEQEEALGETRDEAGEDASPNTSEDPLEGTSEDTSEEPADTLNPSVASSDPEDQGPEGEALVATAPITTTDSEDDQAAVASEESTPADEASDIDNLDGDVPDTNQPVDEDPLPDVPADPAVVYAEALQDAFVRVSGDETINRRSVVRNACMYLNLKYTMAPENYEPETAFHYGQQSTVTSVCSDRGNHNLAFWSRPGRLSGRVGEEITSTPYVWAGSDWPWQFVEKIAAGRPAGDVCTKLIIYDAKSSVNSIYAAGVDCSGFVSRAWGGGARYTTRSIPDATTEIEIEDLQPGDVLNKAGSHVVMFLFWRGPGEMEVIEATTNSACGGVCARTRRIEEFQGYTAYRPRHIEEGSDLSAAEVEQICYGETVTALN